MTLIMNFLVGLSVTIWFMGVMGLVLLALPFYLAYAGLCWCIDKLFDYTFRDVLK